MFLSKALGNLRLEYEYEVVYVQAAVFKPSAQTSDVSFQSCTSSLLFDWQATGKISIHYLALVVLSEGLFFTVTVRHSRGVGVEGRNNPAMDHHTV